MVFTSTSDLERVLAIPLLFGGHSGVVKRFPSLLMQLSFNLKLFSVTQDGHLFYWSFGTFTPTAFHSIKGQIPIITVFLSLLPLSPWSLIFCCIGAVQSALFFKRNCSIYRYTFGVFVGGREFRVFLQCHLGLLSHQVFNINDDYQLQFCLM